jgi:hypothetical protein
MCRVRLNPVPGAVAIVIVLLLLPVIICMSMAVVAVVLGQLLYVDSEVRHQDSELRDLNV